MRLDRHFPAFKRSPPPTYSPRVPAKEPKRAFKVGDKIRVNLHRGRIEEATIKAIIEHSSGKKLQVDFGHDQTALIEPWQVVE
jgi:hypothetical protein